MARHISAALICATRPACLSRLFSQMMPFFANENLRPFIFFKVVISHFSAMSSSESLVNFYNDDSLPPSFSSISDSNNDIPIISVTGSSQASLQAQNRKRRAGIVGFTRINLGNITAARGSSESLNANSISDDDASNCDSPLEDASEKRLRLSLQPLSQCADAGFDQIAELECSQGSGVRNL